MPDGEFELRAMEWTPGRVTAAGLMLAVATLHLAIATATGLHRFALLALGLLSLFVVFFTDLWQPTYHLATAGFVVLMAVVWVVSGMPTTMVGPVEMAGTLALAGVSLYLLFDERRDVATDAPDA